MDTGQAEFSGYVRSTQEYTGVHRRTRSLEACSKEDSKGGHGIEGSVRRECICLILTQNIHKLYIRDDFIVNNDILDFPGCVPIVTYEKSTLIRWRGYMSFRAAFVFFVEKRDNGKKSF